MELWDGYLEDGSLSDVTLQRGEWIPKGLYHGVSGVLVIHEDDNTILVMKRDYNKKAYPGKWEATAGGSVLKGESYERGAIREVLEETGVKIKDLTYISTEIGDHTIYKQYYGYTDIDKNAIVLQEGETIEFQWLTINEFMELCETEDYVSSLKNRQLEIMEYLKTKFER